jgi:proline iminopeptidase
MFADIRDTKIFFDIDGPSLVPSEERMRERPTAFLIHGGPGSDHSGLKARYSALSDKMQLVYFDHRGQGRSGQGDPRRYTLDENVEDMEALRRHLGLGPIVSLGTSYGGLVALTHAARYPNSVSRLIVVTAFSHPGSLARAREIVAERGTPAQIEQCKALFAGEIDTVPKFRRYFEVMQSLYARKHDPALSGAGLDRAILSPEALNQAYGPSGFIWNVDVRPELKSITAPTLILAGRYDWICAPEFSEEIHRLIPGSDLRIFEESAHAVAGDEPQRFLDAVAGFLVYTSRQEIR